jgi:hypothetical protein
MPTGGGLGGLSPTGLHGTVSRLLGVHSGVPGGHELPPDGAASLPPQAVAAFLGSNFYRHSDTVLREDTVDGIVCTKLDWIV